MTERSLRIDRVPASTLCKISWEGGGEVPAALHGHYTTPADAQRAINAWLGTQKDREVAVKNAQEIEERAKKEDKAPKLKQLK